MRNDSGIVIEQEGTYANDGLNANDTLIQAVVGKALQADLNQRRV
jgi:hypothetical protein